MSRTTNCALNGLRMQQRAAKREEADHDIAKRRFSSDVIWGSWLP